MSNSLLTPAEFEAAVSAMGRTKPDSIEIARMVLVDGRGLSEVAAELKISRQWVNKISKKVQSYARTIPAGWVHVDVWLPQEVAEEVERIAVEAQERFQATRA